ncbi:hypothetical protein [Roseimicrobium sp. ORNL1]|uniref:hypothetical protein n=1 Tax=Roseimicrobium sp. ORNL1 TaxID=2711231 RepID=UPI0013E1FD26|nr:hypothetical protein [Roseimicrobium sp. ORNL1]QIF00043.1 hypothetical protein G5S37_00405 [Roseimicrobium sp. ORNL1]
MKTHRILCLFASVALWLAPSAGGLHAQKATPAEAKPSQGEATKPPGDPFVKGKPTPAKPPAAPEAPPHHLVFTFETYKMPQSALDALHEEALAPQPFFDRVRQMVTAGQAALESLLVVPTRSGQRSTVESVDELIYPTEFDPAVPGRPFHFPTAYEMRPLGERIELDPVEGPDGAIVDLNAALSFTRLAGFTAAKADPNADGEVLPVIASRMINSAMSCRIGVPTLMGTTSSPKGTGVTGADGDGSVSITFVRYGHSSPVPADVPAVADDAADISKNIRMVFRFYSLPREKARDLIAETVDADILLQKTTSLPKDEAKLERVVTVITRSGQRSLTAESGEWMYGTEMVPSAPPKVDAKVAKPAGPADPKDQAAKPAATPTQPVFKKGAPLLPAGFSRFETRPTGWRIEVDPVLSIKANVVDLNLAPELVEYRGIVQGHPLLARYPEQPMFAAQKVTTAVTAVVGRQCFLGTMSRPHDTGANGRQDDGRTWFAFVKVTVE